MMNGAFDGRPLNGALDPTLFDPERFPLLGPSGRAMLRRLAGDAHAPVFRDRSGNRLTAEDLADVLAHERETAPARVDWRPGEPPGWIAPWLARLQAVVPLYRDMAPLPEDFAAIPTIRRANLSADVVRFVPDDLPVDRLICFTTSGTTGHPLRVPSHPTVAARYLAYHKRALRRFGIELEAGPGRVGIVLAGFQRRCFTYVSVNPAMGECGLAKINLHPDEWRRPDDRERYLDALAPELISGDPISLTELARLPLRHRPRALLSTSMALSDGLRRTLEQRFGCPVLDLYSMNEAGPIAVFDSRLGGHLLLQPRMYVEILGDDDRPLPEGEHGEIALSGGFNPWLPLLRYRTGDRAALKRTPDGPMLVDLCGRPPVRFLTRSGAWLNNIEIVHAFKDFDLPQYQLHQHADGALTLRLPEGSAVRPGYAARLHALFGEDQRIDIHRLAAEDKVVQFTTDL